jgi:hypothetical protein
MPGAHHRDLARVVAGRLALLVAALVLLVHHDRAEVRERREDGRAGADHDPLLAGAQRAPLVVALAVGERGVEHRHAVAEHGLEAPDGLRCQRDLGDEHDRRAALPLHHLAQQLDVDERLPRPRDAAQQEGAGLRRRGGEEALEDGGLSGGGAQRGGFRRIDRRVRVARDLLVGDLHQPLLRQRADDAAREAEPRGQVRQLGPAAERLQHLPALALARSAGEGPVALAERGELARDPDHSPQPHRRRRARALRLQAHDTRLHQPVDHRPPGALAQLAAHPHHRLRSRAARQPLHEQRLERRELLLGCRLARELQVVAGDVGEHGRQRGAHDLAERGDVVVADPAAELEELERKARLRLQHLLQRSDATSPRRPRSLPLPHHPADPLLPAERHQHPHPHLPARVTPSGTRR